MVLRMTARIIDRKTEKKLVLEVCMEHLLRLCKQNMGVVKHHVVLAPRPGRHLLESHLP